MDKLPFNQLIPGRIYKLIARNLRYGVWDGRDFIGIREKFGARFLDGCEVPGSTAWAVEEVGIVLDYIGLWINGDSIDDLTGRAVGFDQPVRLGGKGYYFLSTGEASEAIKATASYNHRLFRFLDEFEKEMG